MHRSLCTDCCKRWNLSHKKKWGERSEPSTETYFCLELEPGEPDQEPQVPPPTRLVATRTKICRTRETSQADSESEIAKMTTYSKSSSTGSSCDAAAS